MKKSFVSPVRRLANKRGRRVTSKRCSAVCRRLTRAHSHAASKNGGSGRCNAPLEPSDPKTLPQRRFLPLTDGLARAALPCRFLSRPTRAGESRDNLRDNIMQPKV